MPQILLPSCSSPPEGAPGVPRGAKRAPKRAPGAEGRTERVPRGPSGSRRGRAEPRGRVGSHAPLWLHEGMTGFRGERSRGALLLLVVAMTTLLAGCAIAGPAPLGAPPSASPSPTPTAACPQIEGVELPPDCAPYDPDNAMAQNERYRDRVDLSDESREAAEQPAAEVRTGLETLRTSGDLSVEAVQAVFAEAGITDVQTLGDERAVAFGAAAPEGGCIFGEVSAEQLTVEIGGVIMDGGCLPAVGH